MGMNASNRSLHHVRLLGPVAALALTFWVSGCGGKSDFGDGPTSADAASSPVHDCSAPAVDVSGIYGLSIVNVSNACDYRGWILGESVAGVPFDVGQNGSATTGTIEGPIQAIYFTRIGIQSFEGTTNGSHTALSATGTTRITQNGCSYFVKSSIDFTLSGDAIGGTITYTSVTDGTAACAAFDACSSTQSFIGARPSR